ncbi:MAG: hypothetical protein Q7T65_01800 [Thiobacillus sp.]|nr:hypothetical protein [Thiobacillus sp.]
MKQTETIIKKKEFEDLLGENKVDKSLYTKLLTDDLSGRYGEVIGGELLSKALGFPSMAAMKQAIKRKTLKIPTFFIQGRRGRFALTLDVAVWLAECRASAETLDPREVPANFRHE